MHQYQERDGEEDRQPGGHVKRREEGHVLIRMLDAPVQGKRRRGRQTTRWTCQEKGRRARANKNVRCTSTRKETERKTDNQVDMSIERREEGHVLIRMLDAPVPGKRQRGRQKTRWTCQEKGRRAHANKNVRCTSTRKETERKTDNQVDMSREGKKGTC